jgi:multidrug resistance efflux pump
MNKLFFAHVFVVVLMSSSLPARTQESMGMRPAEMSNDSDEVMLPTRGVIRARRSVKISPEDVARITAIPFRVGDIVDKGETLVQFSCDRATAAHKRAMTTFKAKEAHLQAERLQLSYGASGSLSVENALAEVGSAKAEVDLALLKVNSCRFAAPFRGLVVETNGQVGEIAQPSEPSMVFESLEELEVVFVVPSRNWRSLAPGHSITIRIDETGESHVARIAQTAAIIDPVSQSARLVASMSGLSANVSPGMSGDVFLSALEGNR